MGWVIQERRQVKKPVRKSATQTYRQFIGKLITADAVCQALSRQLVFVELTPQCSFMAVLLHFLLYF